MSDKATEWVIDQIHLYGLEPIAFALAIIIAIFFIAGGAIGWLLNQKQTRKQIEKLKLENRKASGEIVKDLASLRKDYNKERELVDLSLRNMGESLRAFKKGAIDAAGLRSCRDEMCSIYQNVYLPAFITYTESIDALCEQPDTRVRAETELIPGLKTMSSFLLMVNMEEMLKITGATAFKLRKESRDGLFKRLTVLLPWWCLRLRWQMFKLRKKTDCHLRDS